MIRIEIIERIARKCRIPKVQAAAVFETILSCLDNSLCQGNRFEIRGLGTFSARNYRGYRGRNPRSGDPVDVKPKRLPHFKPSATLLRRMNQHPRHDSTLREAGTIEPGSSPPEYLRELSAP